MVNRNKNLEKRLRDSGTKWAYTGSMAIKIHGNKLGIPFYRNVGNINIAVNSGNHRRVIPLIASNKGKWNLRSSPNIRNRHTKFISKNGKLNLLSKNLAPPMNKVVYVNGVPVMSINALYNQKRKINNNNNKAKNNINYLLMLDPSLKNRNNKTRRNSPTSKRKRENFGPIARKLSWNSN